ncbi:RING-H2 finger protein ATL57 [Lathyrus oleraceus]|uniref:RING-H2 finger protein ATL57 n=1 Tax=Pisum sativum TaxID=3888 RepID=UPI0021D2495E|nr:RING-H2 finger protein ATL57-like [Pisum sativum]
MTIGGISVKVEECHIRIMTNMDNEDPYMGLRILSNIRTPYLGRFLTDRDKDKTFKKVDNFEDTIQIQILQEQREFHANQNAAWSTRVIPNSQMNMAFGTIAEMARWAIRALPPVKVFNGEEAQECPICMEEFEKGILVQSFGVCAHEYHTSCLNSWLLGGKTSCPKD